MSFNMPTPVEGGADWVRNVEKRLGHIERHRHPDPLVDLNAGRTPKAPENVVWKHVNVGTGWAIRTTWDEVLENTDGTPFAPGGYQIEQQLGGKLVYGDLKGLTPLRPDPVMASLFDRRSLGRTWVGGDGGASVPMGGDESLWLWSDSVWGDVDADGKETTAAFMRNSFTRTKGADRASLQMYAGANNQLPVDVAIPKVTGQPWGTASAATHTVSDGPTTPDGYASITVTTTATSWALFTPKVAITPGLDYACTVTTQMAGINVRVQFQDASGAWVAEGSPVTSVAGVQTTCTGKAPESARTAAIRLSATGQASGWISKFGVFPAPHRMLSWRSPLKSVTYTNLFTNPDGVRSTASTASALVMRNQSPNPSAHVNTTGYATYGGATVSRVVTADAWSGEAVVRSTPPTALTGLAVLHMGATEAGIAGKNARARFRVRGKTVDPASVLRVSMASYDTGSGTGGISQNIAIPMASATEWVTVDLEIPVLPANTNQAGVLFNCSGAAWNASADRFDIDGFEIYYGVGPLPATYFDGSTSPRDGHLFSWTGTAGNSTSEMTASTEVRRNHATNPRLRVSASGWIASGGTITRDVSDTPWGGTGAPSPTLVGGAALNAFRTKLATAATTSVRIGIMGDSSMESTGDPTNTNLGDRVTARLQERLRRAFPAPGVPTVAKGYLGHSTNVPAWYVHPGPVDPPVERLNDTARPLVAGQIISGWAGRQLNLESGHRQTYSAHFDVVRVGYARSVWGRVLRITIDGVVQAEIDTYTTTANEGARYWTSPSLGSATHSIVLEFIPKAGVGYEPGDGSVSVTGIELFDGDRTKGVRVYDLASSGKAAADIANPDAALTEAKDAAELGLDLLVVHLGHNDAGRTAGWYGGVRSSAAFKTDMQTIITKVRANGFTGTILLCGPWDLNAATTEPMANYRAKLSEIAAADSKVAYMDLTQEFGPVATDTKGLYVDTVHPSKKGMELYASMLAGALLPDPGVAALYVAGAAPGVALSGSTITGVGKQFTGSALVKAPAGQELFVEHYISSGPTRGTQSVIATGSWQLVVTSGQILSTDPAYWPVMRVRSSKPFRITDGLFEQAGQAGASFDGASPATATHNYAWAGSANASASVMYRKVPAAWGPFTGNLALISTSKVHRSTSSVQLTTSPDGRTGASVTLPTYSGAGGIVLWLLTTPGAIISARCRDAAQADIAGTSQVITGTGQWQEVRWTDVTGARYITFNGNSITPSADGETFVAEVTVVAQTGYRGPAFSGRMSAPHVEASWSGAADDSTSVLKLNSTDVAGSGANPTSLISATAAGGLVNEYLWLPGGYEKHAAGLDVFANGIVNVPIAGGGWNFEGNGRTYVASFAVDAAAPGGYRFTALRLWASDGIRWGDSAVVSGGYLYVFGASDGSAVVCRTPAGNVMGTRQIWRNGAWVAPSAGAPSPLADIGPGGWSGVRIFDGDWTALSMGGFNPDLRTWQASGPTGPWAEIEPIHQAPTSAMPYVPRWHPQYDTTAQGALIGYALNGRSVPVFVRTPAGAASSSYDAEVWGDRISTESLEYVKEVLSISDPYRVRVRAVNIAGVPSEWSTGVQSTEIVDDPDVPTPSAPVVESYFRGARILWDGLTEYGDRYEGFTGYEVHVGESATYDPNGWTRVDHSMLEGGVTTTFVQDWKRYYVRVVVTTLAGRSAPSDAVPFDPERLSDAALAGTLIENAKFAPGSISGSSLTVSAFSNSIIPNGGFEDVEPLTTPEMPALWKYGWARGPRDWSVEPWDRAGSMLSDPASPISGGRSLRIMNTADTSRQVVSETMPLTPGDIYYVAFKLRTDTMAADVAVSLKMASVEGDVNGFDSASIKTVEVARTGGSRTTMTFEGQVEVPDQAGDGSGFAMKFGAISIDAYATGLPYSTWVDDFEMRKVTGTASLANASINRAKIAYLAVDDARIASMGVGKLRTGYLTADMILGSRIMSGTSGVRTEQNKLGFFGFNPGLTGSETIPVTEIRSSDGGIVSRWLRTNTAGTRIEMGTYGQGADSALMSFYPAAGEWQFPPAFGYGGGTRQGLSAADQKFFMTRRDGQNVPGLAMHAGSLSEAFYDSYGMNMIGLDQVGGIALVTGNYLVAKNGETQATIGSPIILNAGGPQSFIDLLSGGGTDPARLRLHPTKGTSYLSLNQGKLKFLDSATDRYLIQYADETAWSGYPYKHLNIEVNFGGFRVSNALAAQAFYVTGLQAGFAGDLSLGGVLRRGTASAARLRSRNDTTLEWDRYGNPWTSEGTARATNAFWINDMGLMEGGGEWNVPKIKVRSRDSYASWDENGTFYLDGSPKSGVVARFSASRVTFDTSGGIYVDDVGVKSFVIPHPVDEERYLVHAAHEGDDMRVVYEGVGRTEGRETTIVLPDYFEALVEPETDVVLVSALLCAHDQCVCAVKAGRVQGDRFRVVAQGTSHEVDFSWRVTAVRRGTRFEVEPRRDEVQVRGDGPYTYLARR